MAPSTGLISGTPAAAGTYPVTLSATNSAGSGSVTLTLTVTPPAPVISGGLTATVQAGTPFIYQVVASNNPTSYSASGLPAGLSLNSASGVISGTPAAVGSFSVTLSATNTGGTGSATLNLTVISPPPVINGATAANGQVGIGFSYQVSATNSPTGYGASGLPLGLSINASSGLITGAPTAAGTYSATVSASNAAGAGAATLNVTISAPSPPPAAPTNLAATVVSESSIGLTWQDNSNDETGFQIERKAVSGGGYGVISAVAQNVRHFADTSLPADTGFTYRVTASGSSAASSPSNEATATTLPAGGGGGAGPFDPGNVVATMNRDGSVDVTWTNHADPADTEPIDLMYKDVNGAWQVLANVPAGTTSYHVPAP